MAENSFREFVLKKLQLSEDILAAFEGMFSLLYIENNEFTFSIVDAGAAIDFIELSRISKDELELVLDANSGFTQCGAVPWNTDEIFRRIVAWRQESVGYQLIFLLFCYLYSFSTTGCRNS